MLAGFLGAALPPAGDPEAREPGGWRILETQALAAQESPPPPHTPQRGWLGISLELGSLEEPVIISVDPGAPAAAAGLRPGDILLSVDGKGPVEELRTLSTRLEAGRPVVLTVRRGGRVRTVTVVAAPHPRTARMIPGPRTENLFPLDSSVERLSRAMASLRMRIRIEGPRIRAEESSMTKEVLRHLAELDSALFLIRTDSTSGYRATRLHIEADSVTVVLPGRRTPFGRLLAPRSGPPASSLPSPLAPYVLGRNRVAGAHLRTLNPGLAAYFGVGSGVLVLDVLPRSPADEAGLAGGDVIMAASERPVATLEALRRAMAEPGDSITLRVVRRGRRLDLVMRK